MSELTINGKPYSLPGDPRTTLLDFLHQEVGLFGTKKGCDHGQCGACTVLIDGVRLNACLLLTFQLAGKSVVTIEGIAQNDSLHPLQSAFIECDAFQCGYCTSGQICAAVALLDELARQEPSAVNYVPDASSRDDLRERMSGNLCRCGAYPNIIDAIEEVRLSEDES